MNQKIKNNTNEVDIVIPVYNEAENILLILESLEAHVKTPFRVFICYDHDEDNTLPVIRNNNMYSFQIVEVKNRGKGPHGAVVTGFKRSDASAAIMMPADDDINATIIDRMYAKFKEGNDIVAASRFIEGGCMKGCPWFKALLVRTAAFTLNHIAKIPIKDSTNGFKLFSKKVLERITIESTEGFTYSLELVVKCHRLRWKIAEVPSKWYARSKGESRFRVFKWLLPYIRWYIYGFMTTFLKLGPETIKLKSDKLTMRQNERADQ